MDFTNPAGRLHLSQATLHPLVLEYFQGMLHLHTKNIYVCTFKFSTCTCSLGEKTNKQLSLISRTKSATNLSNHIHCGEKWSQINLKCNSYFSRGTRYPPFGSQFSAACNLLLPVHLWFFFFQTLHIYCSQASHTVSASYSSSNSHGLNHGECLSFHIWGCFFQLAVFHVYREKVNKVR